MDASEIADLLDRLARAIDEDRVFVSTKAADEAIHDLGWTRQDILDELRDLRVHDYLRSEVSRRRPGDRVHTFCPPLDEGELWIRVVERGGVVVVSFHRA